MSSKASRYRAKHQRLWALRILLGTVFIISGVAKFLSPEETLLAVSVYLPSISFETLAFLILAVSAMELVLGIGCIFNPSGPIGAYSPLICMWTLAGFVGLAIGRFLTSNGGSCGCFGSMQMLDTPSAALIRDILLLISAIVLVKDEPSVIGKRLSIAIALPILVFGNIAYTYGNGYFAEISRLPSIETDGYESSEWYGLSASMINGYSPAELVTQTYGDNFIVRNLSDNDFAHAIFNVSNNTDESIQDGWIVLWTLSLPGQTAGIFSMAAIYTDDVRIQSLIIEPPHRTNRLRWPEEQVLKVFTEEIIATSQNGFIIIGEGELLLDEYDALANQIANT